MLYMRIRKVCVHILMSCACRASFCPVTCVHTQEIHPLLSFDVEMAAFSVKNKLTCVFKNELIQALLDEQHRKRGWRRSDLYENLLRPCLRF